MSIRRTMNQILLIKFFGILSFGILLTSVFGTVNAQNLSNSTTDDALKNLMDMADGPDTKWAKYFFDNKDYQKCSEFNPDLCTPTINILYESPTTLALSSENIDTIWKAVDEIKKDGYKIDDITSYDITAFESTTYVNILVVMSK